jgi:hypothetical protein
VLQGQAFKGWQFTAEVILWSGALVSDVPDQLPRSRAHAAGSKPMRPELEKRIRLHLRPINGSWRVDDAYPSAEHRLAMLIRPGGSNDACKGAVRIGGMLRDGDHHQG